MQQNVELRIGVADWKKDKTRAPAEGQTLE